MSTSLPRTVTFSKCGSLRPYAGARSTPFENHFRGPPLSRRVALQQLGLAAMAAFAGGCAPLRIALRLYPQEVERDRRAALRVLSAFAEAVIPGAPREDPSLTRVFLDDYYPFAPYCSYFVWDLGQRSARLFGGRRYADLDLESRTRVIEDGLANGDRTTARLYDAAIFLAQIAFYAGIYDDERGCHLIDFEGASELLPLQAQTYAHSSRFLAAEATADGNPA